MHSFTTSPGATIELYSIENVETPIFKEELSLLRFFRIDGLKKKEYILKVIPNGKNLYAYGPTIIQIDLKTDTDASLSKIGEKYLNITLNKIEKKTAAKSK